MKRICENFKASAEVAEVAAGEVAELMEIPFYASKTAPKWLTQLERPRPRLLLSSLQTAQATGSEWVKQWLRELA
jgi:hypothetical protein